MERADSFHINSIEEAVRLLEETSYLSDSEYDYESFRNATPQPAKEETVVKRKFSPGDLVFARMKGYPTWPAQVKSVVSEKPSCRRYSVYFFGTHNSAVIPEKNIYPYAETKARYGRPLKYRGFQLALDEIQEVASLLEQGGESKMPKTEEQEEEVSVPPPELVCVNELQSSAENGPSRNGVEMKEEDDQCPEQDPLLHQEKKPSVSRRVKKRERQENCSAEEEFSHKNEKVKTEKEEPPENESLVPDEEPSPAASWEGEEGQVVKEEQDHLSKMNSLSSSQLCQLMSQAKTKQKGCTSNQRESSCQLAHSAKRRTHGSKKDLVETCRICGMSFDGPLRLKLHFKKHPGQKPFECGVCKSQVSCKQYFKLHMQSHTLPRLYSCAMCSAAYKTKQSLNVHARTHSGIRPFECSICHKKFVSKGYVKIHARLHTNEKPYECSQCEARFTQQSHLKTHMYVHTGVKQFKCEKCNKQFSQSSHLRTHDHLWHSNAKPWKCSYCGRTFKLRHTLAEHIKRHTGEKPYVCKYCGHAFAQSGPLKYHIQKLHSST